MAKQRMTIVPILPGRDGEGVPGNPSDWLPTIADAVPSVLAYWDRDLVCRFGNRACARLFGANLQDLPGKSLIDLIGAGLFEQNISHISAVLAGEPQSFERTIESARDGPRHCTIDYLPHVVKGSVVGFVAYIQDVTRLKILETRLRSELMEREKLLDRTRRLRLSLIEAQRLGNLGSWEWNIPSDQVTWSTHLHHIFGRNPEEDPPGYAEHSQLYTPDSWARLQTAVARILKGGNPYVIELEFIRPDGSTGWIEARAEAVRDGNDAIVGLRGTALDITHRRQAEDERMQRACGEHDRRIAALLASRVAQDLGAPLERLIHVVARLREESATDGAIAGWADELDEITGQLSARTSAIGATAPPVRAALAPRQLNQAMRMMTEDLATPAQLDVVASTCGLSTAHFSRAFKQSTGHPPHRWLTLQRIEHAKNLLGDARLTLSEIGRACGFADQSHFTRSFAATVGLSPGAWRKNFCV